jgi:transcription antitermination factor NusG
LDDVLGKITPHLTSVIRVRCDALRKPWKERRVREAVAGTWMSASKHAFFEEKRREKAMPRLKIGDCVRVLPKDPSPFANLSATIREVHSNDQGLAVLDRYVVAFAWGEEQTFYDVQLEHVPITSQDQSDS